MRKRIAFILLALALLLCLCPIFAAADGDNSSRTVDTEPPTVTGIDIDMTAVAAPGTVTVTVTATDDISGVNDAPCHVYFKNTTTDSELYTYLRMDGDGKLRGTIDVGAGTNAGTYTIEWVYLSDNAGNSVVYYGKGSDGYARSENKLPDDLAKISFVVLDPASSFTGIVTYRSGKTVYLQNRETARLVLLDSTNSQANLDAIQKGRVVTVTGNSMLMEQSGYQIPEIMDAMIVEVADTNTAVAPTAAAIEDLGDGLMARLVRVKTTKAALAAANLQLDLNGYLDEQTLTVTGVLSANSSGRILLGTDIQAEHVPGDPVRENETAATCTAAGSYDEVVYCAACGAELSREEKSIPALGHVEGEPVQENLIPPTVTAEGGYDRVVYCTRCHGELQREHVVLDRLSMAPPTITADPKSANVKSGSKATLSVKAKGKALHYQWYSRVDEQHNWAAIVGATKSSYAVTGRKGNMGWLYRCGVSNEGGTVYSDAATLHVTLQPPVVKTQPKNQAVLGGKTVKFTVKASGKGLTYQWYERPSAQAEWAPVPGGTKATLSLMAIGAMNGSEYYCHVENADGWADSDPAALAVAPQPASVKTQPKDATVKSGAKAKFTVKGAGPNLRYQWFEQAAGSDVWIEIEGATKAEYSFTVSYDNNGSRYYCHVYNDDGFADSDEATLTVTPVAPKFSAQPKDAKVKAGTEARFKVKASGANVTYQWYYRISADGEWILMDGETDAILTVLAAESNFGCQFRCTAAADGLTVDSKIATLKKK